MQFRDLGMQYQALKKEINEGIQNVLNSSAYIMGKPVEELEEQLASYVGRKYCISCGNGTDALQLALMAHGIGPGDAIFTSDFTYIASAGAASILGVVPIFVDIDLDTFNISPLALETSIKETIQEGRYNPRAIIAVDLFGRPADYEKILLIAKKYDLIVIEDGAQGFGGSIFGKRACSFGDISTTSFFPAKPLGCYGDGGALFTDDYEINIRLRSLRTHGKSILDKYDNQETGINSRLDTIQAAVLLVKLKAFEEKELEAVNNVAKWYSQRLEDWCVVPVIQKGYISSWAQYTILLNSKEKRDIVQKKMAEHNIPSMIYYPRGLHQQKAYAWMRLSDDNYANTIEATKRVLSLPMHPYLSENEVDYISCILKSI